MRRAELATLTIALAGCGPRPIQIDTPEVAALGSDCGEAGLDACERACDGGDGAACMVAAHAYENGKGVRVDEVRMAEYETAACDLGVALGCLFHSYSRTLPLKVRHASALRGCELENVKACSKASTLAAGLVATEDADPSVLTRTLEQACSVDAQECAKLANVYRLGLGTSRDPDKARELEQRACEAGHRIACVQQEDPEHVWVSLPQQMFFSRKHAPITPMQFENGVTPAEGVEIVFRAGACFDDSPKPTLVPLQASIAPDFDAAILEDSKRWHFSFGPLYPEGETLCFLEEYRLRASEWKAR